MIYITVAKNIDEAIPEKFKYKSNFSKSIIYFFRDLFKIILEKNIENKKMYILPNLNKKYIEKIRKIIKIRCVNTVVLSETLRSNKEFFNNIKEENVKILDGKWIYRYIEEKLLDYIMNLKNEKLYTQEVSILVNNFNEINIENIKNIAKKVKVLNIVTKKEKMLRKIERNIYEEDGIILNISNNYKRSLSKSDIIINEDFEIEIVVQPLDENATYKQKLQCMPTTTTMAYTLKYKDYYGEEREIIYINNDSYIDKQPI